MKRTNPLGPTHHTASNSLNGHSTAGEWPELAPDRKGHPSRNQPVAITLALRARNETRVVRTLRRLLRGS
jgi:hypothetical protein